VVVADELDPTDAVAHQRPHLATVRTQVRAQLSLRQEGATLPQVVGNTAHRAVELLYGLDPGQRRRDGVPVRGRIDRLYDASGAYVVADYKSGRVPRPEYTATAFFGLWTYAAALAASDPDRVLPDRVELLYLVGRERLARPVVRAVALDHARDLARIWRQILTAVQRTAVTARTSPLCDWCAFSSICPARTKVPLPRVGSDEHAALVGALGLRRRDRTIVANTLERAEAPGERDGPESAR